MKLQFLQCLFLLFFSFNICQAESPVAINSLSLKGILGSEDYEADSSFEQVIKPRSFYFPSEHLAHQKYKSEWWYFSGHLNSYSLNKNNNKRQFAYQFTLFRFALVTGNNVAKDKNTDKSSRWRANNIYMGHLALIDKNKQKSYRQERFSRDALGLAGANKNNDGILQFWLNDWQVKSMQADQLFPLRLDLSTNEFSLQLQLDTLKPIVLQGEQGFSKKSDQYASYYYSYTRLASKGKLNIANEQFKVDGDSWFDREWSTSSLAEDQQGWDWFALHLDDGSELMIYQIRKKDESKDSYSSGILVDISGNTQTIDAKQFQLQILEYWQSPISAIRYPISWLIFIPDKNIQLTISTQIKQQEWSKAEGFSFNYWEGSVDVKGIKNQQAVSGSGYLEMTGYD